MDRKSDGQEMKISHESLEHSSDSSDIPEPDLSEIKYSAQELE